MNKLNNVSFTSKIAVTSYPRFKALNDIKFQMSGFVFPCCPDKTTPVLSFAKMVNKQTRTCTSVNLISQPKETTEHFVAPVHIFHDASVAKVAAFLRRMLDSVPDIKSIIMWGHANLPEYQSEKLFDTAFETLSKHSEVTYFKGHNVTLKAETNAFYTNEGDVMYLAPKSWENESLTPQNETELRDFYDDYHIASRDSLVFEP